ncbi:MAG TPA: carboxypeptidase-like regulatory domain-containing protein, partial [Pyrinomonadaceae bacterium]
MLTNVRRAACLAALLLLCAAAAVAQGAFGSLTGTVRDPAGAILAGASVEATNKATGDKRSAVTNEEGVYTITNLPVGTYTLTVTSAGFAPGKAEDVNVSVSFTTTLDVSLSPAGAAESVTVVGADTATSLNTTDQQLSTLISNKKILDLPLLSRDPNALVLLAPGVAGSSSTLGGFVVNGQRERNNNFLVDGIDNNDA